MSNREISQLFRNIAAAYLIKDDRKFYFQIQAYKNAAEIIDSLTSELKDLYEEGKLQTIPGIGSTISGRLKELFATGSVSHFDSLLKNIPKPVFVLINIPFIGPKRAYKLVQKLRLNSAETVIEDLIIKAKNHEIAKISSFGTRSEQDILRALFEYKEGKGKIAEMTLPYATEIAEKVVVYLKKSLFVNKNIQHIKPTKAVEKYLSGKNPLN